VITPNANSPSYSSKTQVLEPVSSTISNNYWCHLRHQKAPTPIGQQTDSAHDKRQLLRNKQLPLQYAALPNLNLSKLTVDHLSREIKIETTGTPPVDKRQLSETEPSSCQNKKRLHR
jgi:hypothetical protein